MLVFTHDENKATKNTKMLKIWENYAIHSYVKRQKLDELQSWEKKSPIWMLIKFHEFFKKKIVKKSRQSERSTSFF